MSMDIFPDLKIREYELLQQEALEWQKKQFNLLTLSLALIPAVLALGEKTCDKVGWAIVSVSILITLMGLIVLASYCLQQRLKLKAYLQVFHEIEHSSFYWETLNFKFAKSFEVNTYFEIQIALLYALLGSTSIVFPFYIFNHSTNVFQLSFDAAVVSITAIMFILTLYYYLKAPSYEDFIENWNNIKTKVTEQNRSSTD